MTQTTFQADKRGEKKPHQLRKEGLLPGNIFGADGSIAIQVPTQEFIRLYDDVGETGLVYLQVAGDKKDHPVLVEEVQTDPVSGEVFHVSFKQVDLTDKITAEVPVEVIGQFDMPEAVMVVVKDEIEVEALPTDLPEKFEVDVSVLKEIGQMIAYKDLKYDRSKVTLILGEEGEEEPVVLVQEQQEEEPEELPAAPEDAEGEAGETAAEGAEAGESDEEGEATSKPETESKKSED